MKIEVDGDQLMTLMRELSSSFSEITQKHKSIYNFVQPETLRKIEKIRLLFIDMLQYCNENIEKEIDGAEQDFYRKYLGSAENTIIESN